MKLNELFESKEPVWYHGTPELQNFKDKFENRTMVIRYITDYSVWSAAQQQLTAHNVGDPEYKEAMQIVQNAIINKSIRSPVFLSNNRAVANTYADDKRAFDYQAAISGIIKVMVAPARTLRVDGKGQNFRGITKESVAVALSDNMSQQQIADTFEHYQLHIRSNGDKISTMTLAAIADDLGYEIIDVVNIMDNYNGKGPTATVRMVLNTDLITVI
jgi:hypothetical protein